MAQASSSLDSVSRRRASAAAICQAWLIPSRSAPRRGARPALPRPFFFGMDDWPFVVFVVAMSSLGVILYAIQSSSAQARQRAETDLCIEVARVAVAILPLAGRRV